LKRTIGGSKFPLSDANRELKAILEKLSPPRERKLLPPPFADRAIRGARKPEAAEAEPRFLPG
jgi:hypothetical protein